MHGATSPAWADCLDLPKTHEHVCSIIDVIFLPCLNCYVQLWGLLFSGPSSHYWFSLQHRIFAASPNSRLTTIRKVLLEQVRLRDIHSPWSAENAALQCSCCAVYARKVHQQKVLQQVAEARPSSLRPHAHSCAHTKNTPSPHLDPCLRFVSWRGLR